MKRMREPGPQPVKTLYIVHFERPGAARPPHTDKGDAAPAVADHRIEQPTGIERSLQFPIIRGLEIALPLPMQCPADPGRAKTRRPKGTQCGWVSHEPPKVLPVEVSRSRMFGVGAAYCAIWPQKSDAGFAMRNDLMQEGRDGDHRALGRQP